ncbi:MAG: hypothetical protein H6Q17_1738 [Bacteroidetes bacterium]|nr:hypothetical protein [Bacteroidota bacterium]
MNQEIDRSKFDYIEQYYFDHYKSKGSELTVYALLNCISEKEITALYVDSSKDNPTFKNILEKYIVQRSTYEPPKAFNYLARKLLDIYVEVNFRKKIAIRTFLCQFIRTTSPDIIKDYFDILSASDLTIDRYMASKVADLIWCDDVKALLITNYHRQPDEYSLAPLIESLEPELLCSLVEEYWSDTFPSPKQKKTILKRIIHLDDSYLSFLKERDTGSYLESLTMREIVITDDDISTIRQPITEEVKNLLIGNLGLTGNWEKVVKYMELIQPPLIAPPVQRNLLFTTIGYKEP